MIGESALTQSHIVCTGETKLTFGSEADAVEKPGVVRLDRKMILVDDRVEVLHRVARLLAARLGALAKRDLGGLDNRPREVSQNRKVIPKSHGSLGSRTVSDARWLPAGYTQSRGIRYRLFWNRPRGLLQCHFVKQERRNDVRGYRQARYGTNIVHFKVHEQSGSRKKSGVINNWFIAHCQNVLK